MRGLPKLIVGIFLSLWVVSGVEASAMARFKMFMAATDSAEAAFTQEVQDKNGKRLQYATGTMQFRRPGRFRWEYRKPYEQLIIGDGKKFWLYDPELAQVTVKKLDAALGSSPAALLAGSNGIEQGFVLSDAGTRDGLEWVEAVPKSGESSFNRILLGFNAEAELVALELHDAMGNRTLLRFSGLHRNTDIPAQRFHFTPPGGVDVLSD